MATPQLDYDTPGSTSCDTRGVIAFAVGIVALLPMLGFKSLFTVAAGSSIFPFRESAMMFLGMAAGLTAIIIASVSIYDGRRNGTSLRWGIKGLFAGVVGFFASPVVFNLVVYWRGLVLVG